MVLNFWYSDTFDAIVAFLEIVQADNNKIITMGNPKIFWLIIFILTLQINKIVVIIAIPQLPRQQLTNPFQNNNFCFH